jgi:hypothetical protein
MILEIPILESVAQEMVVQFGNVKYRLGLQYNERSQIWTISIMEEVSKSFLIYGMPLVLGQELLAPYNFGIGRMMVFNKNKDGKDPDFTGFTENAVLVWFSEDEVITQ